MRQRKWCVGLAVVVLSGALLLPTGARAADMGRMPVGDGTPTVENHAGTVPGLGIEAAVEWNAVQYKIGKDDNRDQTICPSLALSYNVNDALDLRLTGRWMSAQDETDLDSIRMGIGARFRFRMDSDFIPYVGVGLNYYTLSLEDASDEEGMLGLSLEAGVAWMANDYLSVRLGAQAETSLLDGEARPQGGGEAEDVSIQAIGLGLGVAMQF